MIQKQQDVTSAQVMTEEELWADFMAAEEFRVECWRMRNEAWRAYVRTGLMDQAKGDEWTKTSQMWRSALNRQNELYDTWMRVAYSMYDIPLPDDEK